MATISECPKTITSAVEYKSIIKQQVRENGTGPKILPCDSSACKDKKTDNKNVGCGYDEGLIYDPNGMQCPRQRGVLTVIYQSEK